jgi:hypothetical protein
VRWHVELSHFVTTNIRFELVLKIAHTNYKYKLSLDLVITNKYYKSCMIPVCSS